MKRLIVLSILLLVLLVTGWQARHDPLSLVPGGQAARLAVQVLK